VADDGSWDARDGDWDRDRNWDSEPDAYDEDERRPEVDESDWYGDGTHRAPSTAWHRHRALRLAAVLAAVAAIATLVATFIVVANGDGKAGRPGGAKETKLPVPPGFIDSARTDADPVVKDEFFGAARVTVSGNVYRRLAVKLDNGCPQLSGKLPAILAKGRCRQLVRALYVTEPVEGRRQVLVGMSVFVADEKTTAQAAKDTVAKGEGGVTPLAVPKGSVPNIRITGPAGNNSWRVATTRGHYMIFMQVAYVDGAEGAATDEQLRNTIADMQMVAIDPISTRAIEGHGPPRATNPVTSRPSA
jgi:hypothetical protein